MAEATHAFYFGVIEDLMHKLSTSLIDQDDPILEGVNDATIQDIKHAWTERLKALNPFPPLVAPATTAPNNNSNITNTTTNHQRNHSPPKRPVADNNTNNNTQFYNHPTIIDNNRNAIITPPGDSVATSGVGVWRHHQVSGGEKRIANSPQQSLVSSSTPSGGGGGGGNVDNNETELASTSLLPTVVRSGLGLGKKFIANDTLHHYDDDHENQPPAPPRDNALLHQRQQQQQQADVSTTNGMLPNNTSGNVDVVAVAGNNNVVSNFTTAQGAFVNHHGPPSQMLASLDAEQRQQNSMPSSSTPAAAVMPQAAPAVINLQNVAARQPQRVRAKNGAAARKSAAVEPTMPAVAVDKNLNTSSTDLQKTITELGNFIAQREQDQQNAAAAAIQQQQQRRNRPAARVSSYNNSENDEAAQHRATSSMLYNTLINRLDVAHALQHVVRQNGSPSQFPSSATDYLQQQQPHEQQFRTSDRHELYANGGALSQFINNNNNNNNNNNTNYANRQLSSRLPPANATNGPVYVAPAATYSSHVEYSNSSRHNNSAGMIITRGDDELTYRGRAAEYTAFAANSVIQGQQQHSPPPTMAPHVYTDDVLDSSSAFAQELARYNNVNTQQQQQLTEQQLTHIYAAQHAVLQQRQNIPRPGTFENDTLSSSVRAQVRCPSEYHNFSHATAANIDPHISYDQADGNGPQQTVTNAAVPALWSMQTLPALLADSEYLASEAPNRVLSMPYESTTAQQYMSGQQQFDNAARHSGQVVNFRAVNDATSSSTQPPPFSRVMPNKQQQQQERRRQHATPMLASLLQPTEGGGGVETLSQVELNNIILASTTNNSQTAAAVDDGEAWQYNQQHLLHQQLNGTTNRSYQQQQHQDNRHHHNKSVANITGTTQQHYGGNVVALPVDSSNIPVDLSLSRAIALQQQQHQQLILQQDQLARFHQQQQLLQQQQTPPAPPAASSTRIATLRGGGPGGRKATTNSSSTSSPFVVPGSASVRSTLTSTGSTPYPNVENISDDELGDDDDDEDEDEFVDVPSCAPASGGRHAVGNVSPWSTRSHAGGGLTPRHNINSSSYTRPTGMHPPASAVSRLTSQPSVAPPSNINGTGGKGFVRPGSPRPPASQSNTHRIPAMSASVHGPRTPRPKLICVRLRDGSKGKRMIDMRRLEDERLGSDDDLSEDDDYVADPHDEESTSADSGNVVVCLYEKISRNRRRWKLHLKCGVIRIEGYDYVFYKGTGEAEF